MGDFLSVAVSAVVGYIFLFALSTPLPNLSTLFRPHSTRRPGEVQPVLLRDGAAVIDIIIYNLGSTIGGVLSRPASASRWRLRPVAIASAGRMLYAFSRDDGVPAPGGEEGVAPVSHDRQRLIAIVVVACSSRSLRSSWDAGPP